MIKLFCFNNKLFILEYNPFGYLYNVQFVF